MTKAEHQRKVENPGDIPGLFYDKQKKKYFTIRNSNDPNVIYSVGYIKALKAREEREQFEASMSDRQIGQIKRSRILQTPLAGGLLSRLHGIQGEVKIGGPAVLANGLSSRAYHPLDNLENPMFEVRPRPDLDSSIVDVFIVDQDRFFSFQWDVEAPEVPQLFKRFLLQGQRLQDFFFGHSGPSTSLTLNMEYDLLCMTWLSGSGTDGIAIIPTASSETQREPMVEPLLAFGPGDQRGNGHTDVNCSTSAPISSPYVFVMGTTHGILAMDKRTDASYITPKASSNAAETAPRDTFAVEFLPENPNILLSGGRRGLISIIDLRVPNFGLDADLIRHPGSIAHIKALDPRRVVVAGIESRLAQYDLRYRKNYNEHQHTFASRVNLLGTVPTVTYPDYHNEANHHLGFDIDVEGGIIVAAQERDYKNHHAVRLFDLHSGHTLESPLLTPPPPVQPVDRQVRCLRVVDDRHGGAKSVWLSQPSTLQRFFW